MTVCVRACACVIACVRMRMRMRMPMRARRHVRACVRACVRAYMRECVRAAVREWVGAFMRLCARAHLLGEVDALEVHLPQLQPPSPPDAGSGVVSNRREGAPGYVVFVGGEFLGGGEGADAGPGGSGLPLH